MVQAHNDIEIIKACFLKDKRTNVDVLHDHLYDNALAMSSSVAVLVFKNHVQEFLTGKIAGQANQQKIQKNTTR